MWMKGEKEDVREIAVSMASALKIAWRGIRGREITEEDLKKHQQTVKRAQQR